MLTGRSFRSSILIPGRQTSTAFPLKNKLSILSKNVFYGFCLSINIRKICNLLLPGAITFHIFTVNIKNL